jgi:HAE1 family hydrophobic/amphiphilic exporter-1
MCVRRPVFTWVLILALVVVGIASHPGPRRRPLPQHRLPGRGGEHGAPWRLARAGRDGGVRQDRGGSINSISGIDELRSNSYEGLSVVVARFDLDKDTAVAAQEVRDRVNRTLSRLPRASAAARRALDPDAAPVMLVALSAPRTSRELTEYADRRAAPAHRVAQRRRRRDRARRPRPADQRGARPGAPAVLRAHRVDVQRSLASQNVEIPGGNVDQGATTFSLRVMGRVASIAEMGDLVVATRGGLGVRVRDVGRAEDGEEEASSRPTVNGRDVVMLSVRKQSGTNTLAVIDALQERIAEMRPDLPPGFRLEVVRDEGEFIRNAIHAVEEHLVIGGILASLVVLLFLWNGRSTLIAALAIPTSIISTFGSSRPWG